jgi:hypothetical protein
MFRSNGTKNTMEDTSRPLRYKEPNDRLTHMTEMMKVLDKAVEKGYEHSFRVTEQGLKCVDNDRVYEPGEVTVPNFFRFEGISDPDDMSIVYEIETSDGCKGTLIDAYGVYSDSRVGKFMCAVEEMHKKIPHGHTMAQSEVRSEGLQP